MKPIYLEFCGINSFSEKAQIDFSALLSGGVFGIFGDTGSGKSTILDSIHFALYGEIDRAPKSFNDCINHKSETASVTFDFELTHSGVRRIYRVQRERKRKSGSTKAWLYEKQDGAFLALAEGAREVDEAIERIVGLTFTDFKTCIALPQGDFAALVKSTPSDRVKLVARLFNLERYGERLSKAVNEKLAQAEERVRLTEAKMSENAGGSDELIVQTQEQITQTDYALERAAARLKKAEEEERAALSLQKEKRDFEELERKYLALTVRLPEMEKLRDLLEKLPRAQAVAEKSKDLQRTQAAKGAASVAIQNAMVDGERNANALEQAKRALVEGNFDEKIVAVSVALQKVQDAAADMQAEQSAKQVLEKCIAEYNTLKNTCEEEDFEGKKAVLEEELSKLGEDDTLLDYLKRHYQKILLVEAYGEFRADLRDLAAQFPQTQSTIEKLLKKYAVDNATERTADISAINLAFKEIERKKKLLKTQLDELEKRRRAYEDNEGKKKLLIEQGKLLRQNYEQASAKTAQIKSLGSEAELQQKLALLKRDQLAAQAAIERAQERVNAAYAERQKQEGLFAVHAENEKSLIAQLKQSLQENGFSGEGEALTLVQSVGNPELAKLDCKEFFDEYGSRKRQYESADKGKFIGFDNGVVERAQTEKLAAQREKEELLQTLASLKTALERLLQLREKYKELQKQLAEEEKQRKLCDELKLLLRGNRFLEFIASEYLQEICGTASKTLLSLTSGRYFLQYDKDFKVGDNLDGGNLRAVRTLSGGETFLVSLSLALSLSAAICLKSLRPIEFFFLDEGFGTLDEKLVDTVMDVLNKLSKNFAVGLISHVEELKHRIDNKIVVTGANERHGSQVKTVVY